MDPKAVKVPVTASITMKCVFWFENDEWTGACSELTLTVHGNDFEEAKRPMALAIETHVNPFVRERKALA